MTYEEAEVILDSWLSSVKRVLQPKQKNIVLDGFKSCQLPLYLKLTFDEASRWKSYTPENETHIGANVEEIINALFDRLENKYGKILVSQAFGYITSSKSGLTELELDDLLSLDDTVLNDIYQYWTPPIRRMLPLLWFRLHSEVEEYLIKRGADGVPVVYWYHRQFIETAKKRYLDPEKADELHKNMVEYYVGKWANGKKKPYLNDNGVEVPMDRLVASQPVMYDANPEQPVFNKRKLNELPYHMIHVRQLNELKKEAFCDFDFLSAKLRATSLEELLEDFAYATSIFENDDELHAVNRFFHLSSMALRNDRNQLASQVIGRLRLFTNDDKHPFVGKLVKQAQSSGVTGLPNFVTSEKCLTSPGGALISSLTVNDQNACCSFSCDGVHVFVGSSNKEGLCLQVLVNSTGKLVREFSLNLPEKERAFRWTLKASELHKDLVLVGGAQNMILLDMNTKHVVKSFHVLKESMKNFVYPFAFVNQEKQIAAVSDEGVKVWNVNDRKVIHFIPLPGVTVDTVKALDALGKWVVYSVQDDGFNVLNVEDGNQETIFKLQDTIKEIKITPREQIVVLTSKRKKLHIFDLKSRGLIREVPEFECYIGVNRLHITEDGTKAVSFTDKDILISSLENGQVQRVAKRELFEENIDCTQLFSGDGVNLFAVGYDKVLRVYHVDKMTNNDMINQVSERRLLSGTISSVYPSYGNRYLPTKTITNGQKELTIWDVKGHQPKRVRCLRHEEGINELRMCSPTRAVAKFFSEGSQNCGFGVLDLKEGKIERYLPGDANLLWSVGFTDDSHFMAFSREKRRLQVWDINKGVITFKHRFEKKQPISEAIMNRDQSYVICGLVRNEKLPNKSLPLIAFDCRNNKHHVLKIKKQQLTLHSASISHDGKYLIALTLETVPTLWDVPSGKLLFILPTDLVHATGLSSQNNIAVTCRGDTDAVIQIWSIETGCILSQFDTEPTHKILMNADENVAYTFQGNNFYAWDLSSGKKIASFTMDWAPIPRHVFGVGNAVVVPIPEAPLITTLKLQGQGYDGTEVQSCDEAYGDVTVDGKLLLS